MLREMSEVEVEKRGDREEPVRTEKGKENVSAEDTEEAGMEITNGKKDEEGE